MDRWLWVAAGGALGALGRYLVAGFVQELSGVSFPWGTVAVNLLGSFALGFVIQASLLGGWSGEARLFVAVGFLGAFTTFSTFAFETLELLRSGQGVQTFAYLGFNLVGGLLLVALGMYSFNALRGI